MTGQEFYERYKGKEVRIKDGYHAGQVCTIVSRIGRNWMVVDGFLFHNLSYHYTSFEPIEKAPVTPLPLPG